MNAFGIKDRRNTPLPPLGLPGDPNIPRGHHDVVSPGSSASGAHSGSSQSGLSSISQYSSHGSWPTPGDHSAPAYTFSSVSSGTGGLATPSHHYEHKPSSYDSNSSMYPLTRPSPSAATNSDALSTPTYNNGQQPHFSGLFGHGGGGSTSTLPSHTHTTHGNGLLGSHTTPSTQPPTPGGASASHVESYTRPPPTPSYFSSSTAPQQPSFSSVHHQPSFPPFQPSPTAPSPTTSASAPRGLHSLPSHNTGMAPPQPYRPYSYQMHIPSMGGTIMSNLSNPGGQLSVMSGMNVHSYGAHLGPSMYGHPMNPQAERPFKCDQCPQSFNRNHDLKRHKRIHLSVKPFPCGSCEKAFSRKDALKRHRLVKGCGEQRGDDGSNLDSAARSDTSASESPTITKSDT